LEEGGGRDAYGISERSDRKKKKSYFIWVGKTKETHYKPRARNARGHLASKKRNPRRGVGVLSNYGT